MPWNPSVVTGRGLKCMRVSQVGHASSWITQSVMRSWFGYMYQEHPYRSWVFASVEKCICTLEWCERLKHLFSVKTTGVLSWYPDSHTVTRSFEVSLSDTGCYWTFRTKADSWVQLDHPLNQPVQYLLMIVKNVLQTDWRNLRGRINTIQTSVLWRDCK